ncbi:WD40 repeat-like protein [Exidia glandulosa HHB12029]|uniref:Ribosome biogenesis protein NSA1 n=1 Tax=Exidia glandulosa HHB12029 TaxID=1314781 RepID=A0A165GV89_EXIGL|nr:WD40 repeat-like protein [Exidia glandulosa HHB12029]
MSSLRFYAGDQLGRIHALNVALQNPKEPQIVSQPAYIEDAPDKTQAVRILKLSQDAEPLVACARADSSAAVYSINEDASLNLLSRWKPARTGLWLSLDFVPERGILTCSTTGHVALSSHEGELLSSATASLPAKLKDLRLSGDSKSFATGGDEVELSTWDLEKTLASDGAQPAPAANPTKKRKAKNSELLPGETWRAQNVPNDELNLRVPVHVTSLCYLGDASKSNEIVTGTSFGAVRQYDTRTKRRPVANWTEVVKKGGISRMERGVSEHDVFLADERGQLFALDLRNGKQLYSYKGIGGTVNSMTLSGSNHILSSSMDRYVRLHTTFPAPSTAGKNMDGRGEIVAKLYTQDVVTAVASTPIAVPQTSLGDEEDGEDIWDQMQSVDDDEEDQTRRKRRKT